MCLMKDQWVECGNGEKITKQEFLLEDGRKIICMKYI